MMITFVEENLPPRRLDTRFKSGGTVSALQRYEILSKSPRLNF